MQKKASINAILKLSRPIWCLVVLWPGLT